MCASTKAGDIIYYWTTCQGTKKNVTNFVETGQQAKQNPVNWSSELRICSVPLINVGFIWWEMRNVVYSKFCHLTYWNCETGQVAMTEHWMHSFKVFIKITSPVPPTLKHNVSTSTLVEWLPGFLKSRYIIYHFNFTTQLSKDGFKQMYLQYIWKILA